MENTKQMRRSGQQRKSIEVYCKRVADAMNDAGHSVQEVFTAELDISQENIKKGMFKVVMRALYPNKVDEDGNISTTDLDSDEVTKVYENMNRITAERYGVSMDFPSKDSMFNEAMGRKR